MTDPVSRVDALSPRHIDQLMTLYRPEWWTSTRTRADVERLLTGPSRIFGYTDAGGDLVGFARVLTDGVYKAFIFDVIVAPSQRGTGMGERILRDILEDPVVAQVLHVELYCKPDLEAFYERFGFSKDVGGITLMRRTRR